MKRRIAIAAIVSLLGLVATVTLAHHAAQGLAPDEVWAMIDALVADTPHATMTIDDLGGGMVAVTITTQTIRSLESMMDDGLLTYIAMLDDVELRIVFDEMGGASASFEASVE